MGSLRVTFRWEGRSTLRDAVFYQFENRKI
jgi:hypothetical protein